MQQVMTSLLQPGSYVLSAWTPSLKEDTTGPTNVFFNDFNLLSGTSAACAHASGVAALLRSAHPEWSPATIRSATITTANPMDNTFDPIQDYGDDLQFASPLAMGAGQIDPNRARFDLRRSSARLCEAFVLYKFYGQANPLYCRYKQV